MAGTSEAFVLLVGDDATQVRADRRNRVEALLVPEQNEIAVLDARRGSDAVLRGIAELINT
jgi:hypothetical protein